MIYRVEIEAVTPVSHTEDPERVIAALEEVFPSAEIEHQHGELIARAHEIERLSELINKQRIQETARATLLEAIEGDTISFAISKQAAHAGVVNFALDDPAELGDIHIHIRVDQPSPAQLVEFMTRPDTEE